ncbi:hypothetical protein WA026_007089 [Henosepilachna vigintioctopunctata]|uniref:G-patch domain-containing protein n=1 Tax=Henosepilachna vigintioctopunctata TaxID=420089 RepID=A0AAW1V1W9_9CUCU
MNPDNKKISFGFSKLIKKQSISAHPTKPEKTVELVECLEGSEIKVKNAVEKPEKLPLIIPIKGNANNLVGRIERESLKNKRKEVKAEEEDTRSDSELTVEELAARQLLREARNRLTEEKDTTKVHTLPLKDENVDEDGEEPTLEDYENVPVEGYGLAILRGMGWKEGMGIGKSHSKSAKPIQPELRPKGLGLGAQKMVNLDTKDVFDKNGKQLVLMKGAYAKIIVGSHKGTFCEVQGLNEESGRIIVKASKTNEILSLNELFLIPITKEDYSMGLKIINNVKYERYKEQGLNKKNTSHHYLSDEHNYRSNNSQEVENNEEYVFNKRSIKIEKEEPTHYEKSLETKQKLKESSSEDEHDRKKSKSKDKKRSSSKSIFDEKRHSRRRNSYEKEKIYSSENCSSEESYYSKKKHIKGKDTTDSYSECSSSSEERRERHKRKKNRKSKRDRKYTSDLEYKSRESKQESKEKSKGKQKSRKVSECKRDSSCDSSSSYKKYRSRKR